MTVAFTNLLNFNGNFYFGKIQKSQGAKSGCGGARRCFIKNSLHESCRMGRRIDADSLICSLGHCKCNGHTVHKLSQRRLTADLLAPRESDSSRMRRRSPPIGYQVTSRPQGRFSRYSKWLNSFRTGLVLSVAVCMQMDSRHAATVSIRTSAILWHSTYNKGKNKKQWLVLTDLHMKS